MMIDESLEIFGNKLGNVPTICCDETNWARSIYFSIKMRADNKDWAFLLVMV